MLSIIVKLIGAKETAKQNVKENSNSPQKVIIKDHCP